LLQNPVIKRIVAIFITQLKKDGQTYDQILGFKLAKRADKGIGLLYFILMELYLQPLESIIFEYQEEHQLKFLWSRCMNVAFMGF
jgi:hypothetical protein